MKLAEARAATARLKTSAFAAKRAFRAMEAALHDYHHSVAMWKLFSQS